MQAECIAELPDGLALGCLARDDLVDRRAPPRMRKSDHRHGRGNCAHAEINVFVDIGDALLNARQTLRVLVAVRLKERAVVVDFAADRFVPTFDADEEVRPKRQQQMRDGVRDELPIRGPVGLRDIGRAARESVGVRRRVPRDEERIPEDVPEQPAPAVLVVLAPGVEASPVVLVDSACAADPPRHVTLPEQRLHVVRADHRKLEGASAGIPLVDVEAGCAGAVRPAVLVRAEQKLGAHG